MVVGSEYLYSRIRLYHPRIYHPAAYISHLRPEPIFYIIKPSGYIIQPSSYIGHGGPRVNICALRAAQIALIAGVAA